MQTSVVASPIVAHRWQASSVSISVVDPGPGTGLTKAELQTVAERAIDAWKRSCQDCNLPRIILQPVSRGVVREDGTNVLLLRTGLWCPPEDRDTLDCYDPGRAAITHSYPVPDADGHLLREADIELNAIHYRWSPRDEAPEGVSLDAVVLHEIGHFYGLIHSAVPSAVMYSQEVRPGKMLPLVPTSDDIAALRALYPRPMSAGQMAAYCLATVCTVALVMIYGRRVLHRWRSWSRR